VRKLYIKRRGGTISMRGTVAICKEHRYCKELELESSDNSVQVELNLMMLGKKGVT